MSDKKFDNSGMLWPNDSKTADNNHPNMKGKINVDGKEYELSGWTQTNDDGDRRLSLKVQLPWKERQAAEGGQSSPSPSPAPAPAPAAASGDNDDLPF